MSDAQQLLMEYEVAQQRLAATQQRLEQIEGSVTELRRAEATLESLVDGAALVPVGAGVHVHAELKGGHAVVPIGADQAAQMPVEDALVSIRERATEAESILQRLMQEAQQTAGAMQQMRQQLEASQAADDS